MPPQPLTPQEQAQWDAAMSYLPGGSAMSPGAGSPTSHAKGLTPAEEAAWENVKPVGWGQDSLKSYLTGVARTAANTAAMPHAVATRTPSALDVASNQVDSLASLIGYAANPHGAAPHMPGLFNAHAPLDPSKVDNPVGAAMGTLTSPFAALGLAGPTQQQADAAAQGVIGPYHAPQTWQGRAADVAGQLTPAALFPGSLPARVARVAVPTATSTLGEIGRGTPYEAPLRSIGLMGGGLMEGGLEGLASKPEQLFGRAAANASPEQFAAASDLRARAAANGIDLTIPEALDHVTNGATTLGRVQRIVESANRTAPQMGARFAERPAQMRSAVMGLADAVSPDRSPPGMLAADANRAAGGALMDANSVRGQLARPYYDRADAQSVDPNAMDALLGSVRSGIDADKTGLIGPRLGKLHQSLTDYDGNPILDQGNLSTARNYWRDQLDLPPTGVDPLTKHQAGIISEHLDTLDRLLKSNPDRQMGDQVYGAASRNIVDPLQTGPLGRIASDLDLGAQTSALYPSNPALGQPAATSRAVDALEAQRQGLAAALTRHHIGDTYNQATRDLTGGPNQYGGARFASNIAGNAEQAATLRAGMNSFDPSGDVSGRFADIVDALQATGRRQRPGSMTAFNTEDQAALKLAPLPVRTFGALTDPLEWGKNLSNWSGGRLYNRNLDNLARLIWDPDTQAVLARTRAAQQGGGFGAQVALPAYIAATQGGQP